MRWVWRAQTGATKLEYVALIVLAAGVVTAVLAWGLPTLPNQVNTGVSNAICNILNLGDCEEANSTDVADGESNDPDGDGTGTGDSDDGNGDGDDSDTGDGVDPDEVDTDLPDPLVDPDLALALWEAEDDLADAEDALAEAEASDDDLLDELLDLLWEITGGADIERCFTEGDIGSCIMAAIGLIPWGKLLKVGSKIPKMWRLFDRWRDARRLRNTRRANIEDARTRHNEALDACRVGNSFPPGTPVLLGDGSYAPIEEIDLGDEVWAFDPLTGVEGPREVTAQYATDGEKTLVEVTVTADDGTADTLVATGNHPFWVPDRAEWVDATDLEPGTWLRTSAGSWVMISAIDRWAVRDQAVHNLTVAELHTYYVVAGENTILVSNCNGVSPGGTQNLRDGVSMRTQDALDTAEDFLGPGYRDMGNGRFVSADGLRQVRMTDRDLAHPNQPPHMNFETYDQPTGPGVRGRPSENIHVYLPEETPP